MAPSTKGISLLRKVNKNRVWMIATSSDKFMHQTKVLFLLPIALPMVPELQPILHTTNLLSSEMIHFVHQVSHFYMPGEADGISSCRFGGLFFCCLSFRSFNQF